MAVLAPVPGFSLAALARLSAELSLPEAAAPALDNQVSDKQTLASDVVVFSSAPMRILSDLATAGLRQLSALLPMIERAVQDESATPLGYLAKAAGAAARQIGEGQAALIAEGPDRVAAALQGQVALPKNAPANAAMGNSQSLRTLARQLGAESEPQQESGPGEPVRAIARQIGEARAALPAAFQDRLATVRPGQVPLQAAAASVAIDTKQTPQVPARQSGETIEPEVEGRTNESLRELARQIGSADRLEPRLLAEPGADPIQRWLGEAKHVLRSTGDALDQAEQQLRPLATAPADIPGASPAAWALAEIVAAQAQVATAYASLKPNRLGARRSSRRPPSLSLPLDNLAGATTMLGVLLIVAALWFIGGLWATATGIAALAATAFWVWRISLASRDVRLDAHR